MRKLISLREAETLVQRRIDDFCFKAESKNTNFITHKLIQTQIRDYIRETQTRLILKPIADRLLVLSSPAHWARTIRQWLDNFRQASSQLGYAGGNLLNLLIQMQIDLSDWDFSRLPVWSASLKGVNLL